MQQVFVDPSPSDEKVVSFRLRGNTGILTDDFLDGLRSLLAEHGLSLRYVLPMRENPDGTRTALTRQGRYGLWRRREPRAETATSEAMPMKSLMQTPRQDEPFTLPGLLIDLTALATIVLFVTVATAFIPGAG